MATAPVTGYAVAGTSQIFYCTLTDYQAYNAIGNPIRAGCIIMDPTTTPATFLGISDGAGGFTQSNGVLNSAAASALVSQGKVARSSIATRLYVTNVGVAAANAVTGWGSQTTLTSAMLTDVETDFDAVSLIVMNFSNADCVVTAATAATPTQTASFGSNLGNTGTFLFGGSTGVTVPAGTVALTNTGANVYSPNFTISDPLPLSSTARTDGGPRPLLLLNMQETVDSAGAQLVSYFNRSGASWGASVFAGNTFGRICAIGEIAGAVANSSLTSGNLNQAANSRIFGFCYWARGVLVKTLLCNGDSITAASALTTGKALGFGIKACQSISTKNAPYEPMIFGLAGQTTQVFEPFARTFIKGAQASVPGAMQPTHMLLSAGTPNGNTPTFNQASINTMNQQLAQTMATARLAGVQTALFTVLPQSASATTPVWTGSNATFRAAFNASLSNWGVPVLDYGGLCAATGIDTSEYATIGLGFPATLCQADFIHPNDIADTRFGVGDGVLPGGLVAPWLTSTA